MDEELEAGEPESSPEKRPYSVVSLNQPALEPSPKETPRPVFNPAKRGQPILNSYNERYHPQSPARNKGILAIVGAGLLALASIFTVSAGKNPEPSNQTPEAAQSTTDNSNNRMKEPIVQLDQNSRQMLETANSERILRDQKPSK